MRWEAPMSSPDHGTVNQCAPRWAASQSRRLAFRDHDFWRQRITAVAMVLLIVPVIVVVMMMLGSNQAAAKQILSSPLVAIISCCSSSQAAGT